MAATTIPATSSSLSFLPHNAFSFPSPHSHRRLSLTPSPNFRPPQTRQFSTVIECKAATRRENRTARHARVRKKVNGTPERPRMSVFRSNKHIYVQVIDDTKMHTLASASTMQKSDSEEFDYSSGPTLKVLLSLSHWSKG